MTFEPKEGPELYDPTVVDALCAGYPVDGASHADLAAAVQRMQKKGYSIAETAAVMGMLKRRVDRLRATEVEPYPDMVAEYDIRERRVRHLERVADTAMTVAVEMRQTPEEMWLLLRAMGHHELVEMVMVLGCMVDVERTTEQALGWVTDPGMAQVIPIRKEA